MADIEETLEFLRDHLDESYRAAPEPIRRRADVYLRLSGFAEAIALLAGTTADEELTGMLDRVQGTDVVHERRTGD